MDPQNSNSPTTPHEPPEPKAPVSSVHGNDEATQLARAKLQAVFSQSSSEEANSFSSFPMTPSTPPARQSSEPEQQTAYPQPPSPRVASFAVSKVMEVKPASPPTTPLSPDHQLPAKPSEHLLSAPAQAPPVADMTSFILPNNAAPSAPAVIPLPEPTPSSTIHANVGPQSSKRTGLNKPSFDTVAELKERLGERLRLVPAIPKRTKPLLRAALIMAVIYVIYNSQLIIGQIQYYTSPGSGISTPIIVDPTINTTAPPDPRIIIPKINVDAPVVYDETSYDERLIQAALERGVVHYGNTALPGQVGNTVIVGHSSNNFWNAGNYKTAFALLDRMNPGDTFIIHYNSTRYIYEIYDKRVVEPNDFSIITQDVTEPIVTLITCTPPGTSKYRLITKARQISPDPQKAQAVAAQPIPENINAPLPSNTRSMWDDIRDWLF